MGKFLIQVVLMGTVIFYAGDSQGQTSKAGKQTLNPDTSANILGLYRNSDRGNKETSETPNGFSIQEVELQFTADVDPYFRANAVIAIHPEASHEHEEHAEEAEAEEEEEHAEEHGHAEYSVEPEEVYIETISLPGVYIRAGKFFAAVGKHNTTHTHAFPFIDAPLINQELLGDHGLNDTGISAAYLFPLPWYMELTAQALENGNALFASNNANDVVGVGRLKNLFDFGGGATVELGLSVASGDNPYEKKTTLNAADLTFKWRPEEGGKYTSLAWSTEYMVLSQDGIDAVETEALDSRSGYATWVQYQFAQRWWVQARHEFLEKDVKEGDDKTKDSVLLGFVPSEFSSLRLQYDILDDGFENNDGDKDNLEQFSLQMNVSIGAHPAHAY